MSFVNSSASYDRLSNGRIEFAWQHPFTVEANPENLKKCIRLEGPFLFKFSEPYCHPYLSLSKGSNSERIVYSPIEYAIKSNDLESLRYLFKLPDCAQHFSIADVFFYMGCLKEDVAPNLEILALLLDSVQDINAEVEDAYSCRSKNLLDCAIDKMGKFRELHSDVIEELFRRGVKISNVSGYTPFERLKVSIIPNLQEPLLKVLPASRHDPLSEDTFENDDSSVNLYLNSFDMINVYDSGDLYLNRLYKYLKLEKKYDLNFSSFLTLKDFKWQSRFYELRSALECIKVCSRFIDYKKGSNFKSDRWLFVQISPSLLDVNEEESLIPSVCTSEESFSEEDEIPFGLFCPSSEEDSFESSGSSELSEWLCFDAKDGCHGALMISLYVFHRKITRYAKFFNALVKGRTFDECFKEREISDITGALSKIAKQFPLDTDKRQAECREEILSTMYACSGKV